MKTMYEAIANSPETMLKATLNATDTTVSVVDASVLPQAPNLACIGSGDTTETIRYGAIDSENNLLLNCERGFQGVASKHLVNTRVSRNFTAYDNNTFKENIEALKVDVDGLTEDVNNIENKITQFTTTNNILINSNFRQSELVNQRGQTVYNSAGYCLDMWRLYNAGTAVGQVELLKECIKISPTILGSGNYSELEQLIENPTEYAGKTITVTVDFEASSGAYVGLNIGDEYRISGFGSGVRTKQSFTTIYDGYNVIIGFKIFNDLSNNLNDYLKIYNVKLELGEISTPFVDDDRATKLAKCQYYFERVQGSAGLYFAQAIVMSGDGKNIQGTYKVSQKRTIPYVNIINAENGIIFRPPSSPYPITLINSAVGWKTGDVFIVATIAASITVGTSGFLRFDNTNVYIDISAEL